MPKHLKSVEIFSIVAAVVLSASFARSQERGFIAVTEPACGEGDRDLSARVAHEMTTALVALDTGRFMVLARERLDEKLKAAELDTAACPGGCLLKAGTVAETDLVMGGALEKEGEGYRLELSLVDVATGGILGIEEVVFDSPDAVGPPLSAAVSRMARLILEQSEAALSSSAPADPAMLDVPLPEPPIEPEDLVEIVLECPHDGVEIYVDGMLACAHTPCRQMVTEGEHRIEMEASFHRSREETVTVAAGDRISWVLEPESYSYFGMNGVTNAGYIITAGISPTDDDYKQISVLDMMHFAELNDYADVGFGGGIFSYNETARGAHWGIFGLGPSIRFGRLMILSKVHLLSFRHRGEKAEDTSEGWLPGITTRATLPLVNNREWRGWGSLVPALSGGLDVWFDDNLEHDQTGWWLGFSWLGYFDF